MWASIAAATIVALLTASCYATLSKQYPQGGVGSSYFYAEAAFLEKQSHITSSWPGSPSSSSAAWDSREDRDVVLKFPHEEIMGDVATHERFSREVKIGHLLTHPNIQQLYGLATVNNSEFLVLEYVPGRPLRDVLREHQPTPEDYAEAVTLGVQIARALAYAHENHVAHRDLKPENIIVMEGGEAKVMDFGIASMQGARRVTWGPLSSQVGMPDYMSPEQIQGGRGDSRTDVYALGMILYEYVAGRLPYDGDNSLAVMNQHVTTKAPPLHFFRPDVPPPLEEIVMKAIRCAPADRWQGMDELSAVLEHWGTVDVPALCLEREQERGENPRLGSLAGKLNVPAFKTNLLLLVVLVLLLVVLVLGVSLFGRH